VWWPAPWPFPPRPPPPPPSQGAVDLMARGAPHGGRRRHLVSPRPTSSSSLPRCGGRRRRRPPPLPPQRRRSSSTRRRVPPLHGGSGDGSLRRWCEEPYHLARAATPGSASQRGGGRLQRGGGRPAAGPAMCCIFLFFFFCLPCVLGHGARQSEMIVVRFRPGRTTKCRDCRAFLYQRTTKTVTCLLVWASSVAFLCRAPPRNARQRLFTVRCQTRRTTKGLYRAKCYCVPFVVRPDEKRTAKSLPCVLGPLPCARGTRQSRYFPL
jgi:hypothetical protein